MPQANIDNNTPPDTRVIVLADWREANAAQRREMAARQFSPDLYRPIERADLDRDLIRIMCGVHTIGRSLENGTMSGKLASTVLKLIHDDLSTAAEVAFKLDRKLAKAKRKAKKHR